MLRRWTTATSLAEVARAANTALMEANLVRTHSFTLLGTDR